MGKVLLTSLLFILLRNIYKLLWWKKAAARESKLPIIQSFSQRTRQRRSWRVGNFFIKWFFYHSNQIKGSGSKFGKKKTVRASPGTKKRSRPSMHIQASDFEISANLARFILIKYYRRLTTILRKAKKVGGKPELEDWVEARRGCK
jgi:hypothetical protein